MDAEALSTCNASGMAVTPGVVPDQGFTPGVVSGQVFTPGVTDGVGPNAASALWNAMVTPFLKTSIFGVIW